MKQTLTLAIDGMHCGGCVARVTNTLKKLETVEPLDVQVGSAKLTYDAASVQPQAVLDALQKIGFTAREV